MTKLKKVYLTKVEELGHTPNFFMSETYINQPSIQSKIEKGWLWLEEGGVALFPAVPIWCWADIYKNPLRTYWAGFANSISSDENDFLDYQYIYDPKNFLNMEGGHWATFRKNSRKWLKKHVNYKYTRYGDTPKIHGLLAEWLERHMDTVQDADFLIDCILNPPHGSYIRYLYDEKANLVAINFADENYQYLNYRFLICKKEPFLDEFTRLRFYLDPYIQEKGKMVNDGGSLSFEGLEKFKDKLNPIKKLKIYSNKC